MNLGMHRSDASVCRLPGIEMERAKRARAFAHARPGCCSSGQALAVGCSSLRGSNGRIWMVVSAMLLGR
jgi:hypothetical protein